MNIMNTATVISNESTLRALSMSADVRLPPMGVAKAPDIFPGKRKFQGSISMRPLSAQRSSRKRPSSAVQESDLEYMSANAEAACGKDCFRVGLENCRASSLHPWTVAEEVIFAKSKQLWKRDACRIAAIMRTKPCCMVHSRLLTDGIGVDVVDTQAMSKTALLKKHQQIQSGRRNNYYKRHKLLSQDVNSSQPALGDNALPEYTPCSHDGPCTVDNGCSCAKKLMMCEKYCTCSSECKNRWAGCTCKRSRCNTRACPCYAAQRECDPDLCLSCGACVHPKLLPDLHRRCQNVCIQTDSHKHLWLGPSAVHGWGGFVKEPIEKNGFIHEYVGEAISQQEAERRGRVYDVQRLSFLFNLSDVTVVDATRKGNKTKFINHASSTASRNSLQSNVEVRYILACGERHISLYAQRAIEANEELFFDYNYTNESHQLHSPAVVGGAVCD